MNAKLVPCAVSFQRQTSERNMDHPESMLKRKNYSSWSRLARGAAEGGRFVSSQELCLFSKEALVRVVELLLCLPLGPGSGAVPAFLHRTPLLLEAEQLVE